ERGIREFAERWKLARGFAELHVGVLAQSSIGPVNDVPDAAIGLNLPRFPHPQVVGVVPAEAERPVIARLVQIRSREGESRSTGGGLKIGCLVVEAAGRQHDRVAAVLIVYRSVGCTFPLRRTVWSPDGLPV